MECLKTFTVNISAQKTITAPEAKFWGLAPQNYWVVETGFASTSLFNIEGFKNINIYKIKAVGNIGSQINSTSKVIVDNWSWWLKIGGRVQNIGGNVRNTPNFFTMSIETVNPNFVLDKYNRTVEFEDPITSCTFFEVYGLQASGIGSQDLTSVNLEWQFSFIVYYKFEGED